MITHQENGKSAGLQLTEELCEKTFQERVVQAAGGGGCLRQSSGGRGVLLLLTFVFLPVAGLQRNSLPHKPSCECTESTSRLARVCGTGAPEHSGKESLAAKLAACRR